MNLKVFVVTDEELFEVCGPIQLIKFANEQSLQMEHPKGPIISLKEAKKVLKERGFEVKEVEIY